MRVHAIAMAVVFSTVGAAFGADPAELNNQGVKLSAQRQYAEAEATYRKALEGWALRDAQPESALGHAHTLENLGALLRITGRYSESEPILTEALSRVEAAAGASSADVGEVLEHLAALYRAKGSPDKAESCALRADKLLPDPERIKNRALLASIYIDQRRFAEARSLLEPALPGAAGTFGFTVYADLAAAALGEQKLTDAETFARHALEIADAILPSNHVGVAVVWNNLGQVYRFQERYVDAEAAYRKAIEIWTAARGPEHPLVAHGLQNLAAFEAERGRNHAAEDLFSRAAAIFEKAVGPDGLQTLIARNELGEVLRAEGRYVASQQCSRTTLPAIQKLLPESDPRVLRALTNYARLLASTQRQPEATAVMAHIRLVTDSVTGSSASAGSK